MLKKFFSTIRENVSSNQTASNVNDPAELLETLDNVVKGYEEFCRQLLAGEK